MHTQEIIARLEAHYPHAKPGLDYQNAYQLLTAPLPPFPALINILTRSVIIYFSFCSCRNGHKSAKKHPSHLGARALHTCLP